MELHFDEGPLWYDRTCGGEVLMVGSCAAGAFGIPPGPEGSNGTEYRWSAVDRLT